MKDHGNLELYKNMFLLTKQDFQLAAWYTESIADFKLHIHPHLNFTKAHNASSVYLIGDIFDYKNPTHLNQDILDELSREKELETIFSHIEDFAGQYVMIIKNEEHFILLNDACAQSEVYYNEKYQAFASQISLLTEVIKPENHTDKDTIDFYNSDIFRRKKHNVGNTTPHKNIFHLLSNHYVDLHNHKVLRFYPHLPLSQKSTDEVAQKAAARLKSIILSMAHRYPLAQAVTGGYDSRVLFLASLETNAKYFVARHAYMSQDHYDIWVPQKLTSLKNRNFEIFVDDEEELVEFSDDYLKSVDYPRRLKMIKHYENHLFINGNLSEIARNTNGYSNGYSGEDFSFLYGSETHPFPSKIYTQYIDSNQIMCNDLGFDIIDLIHWEEQMSNWAAKSKTETKAEGRKVYSPFNSRGLLNLLLSTKRIDRDSHLNKLYDRIIYHLCDGDKEITKLPINPSFKQNAIRLMKRLKLYNIYRKIGVKTRRIKL